MAETTRLQLPHPGSGAAPVDIPADFQLLVDRLAAIVVGYLETTLAERPAASAALVGYLHWATDEEVLTWCTGTAWFEIGSGVGVEPLTQTEIDALVGEDLFDGRLVFNKTTRNFQEYRDPPGAWTTQQLIHVGPTAPLNPRPYMVWIDTSDDGVPVTTSHAALADLEVGDPHPQYMTEAETAAAIALTKLNVESDTETTPGADEATTSITYTDLATVGPTVTLDVPASGEVLVAVGCGAYNSGVSGGSSMSFAMSGANTLAADNARAVRLAGAPANVFMQSSKLVRLTGLTPGSTTFTAKYAAQSGTSNFRDRDLIVIPVP